MKKYSDNELNKLAEMYYDFYFKNIESYQITEYLKKYHKQLLKYHDIIVNLFEIDRKQHKSIYYFNMVKSSDMKKTIEDLMEFDMNNFLFIFDNELYEFIKTTKISLYRNMLPFIQALALPDITYKECKRDYYRLFEYIFFPNNTAKWFREKDNKINNPILLRLRTIIYLCDKDFDYINCSPILAYLYLHIDEYDNKELERIIYLSKDVLDNYSEVALLNGLYDIRDVRASSFDNVEFFEDYIADNLLEKNKQKKLGVKNG